MPIREFSNTDLPLGCDNMLTDTYPKTVTLKDMRKVVLRLLDNKDFEPLFAFFNELSEADRIFLRHDVSDPKVVRKWTENLDLERVIPLVAQDGEKIVGDGTLHIPSAGWMQHVGHLRLVVAESHRRNGLGALLARELVYLAEEKGLAKLQVHLIEDDQDSTKMFEKVGFAKVAVLPKMVKDREGQERNLAIMINDVTSLERAMEDWIHDTMIPAFRVPGGEG